MRRWYDKKIIANHFVEWQGTGVKSVKNGFARAVEVAKLDLSEDNVTPHTLRRTAATWLMQLGTDPWEAAGFLGMSVKVLIDTYGHHHPDYMKEAAGAITKKRETAKRVVGARETAKPAILLAAFELSRPRPYKSAGRTVARRAVPLALPRHLCISIIKWQT
jgi:hypothetical protein